MTNSYPLLIVDQFYDFSLFDIRKIKFTEQNKQIVALALLYL